MCVCMCVHVCGHMCVCVYCDVNDHLHVTKLKQTSKCKYVQMLKCAVVNTDTKSCSSTLRQTKAHILAKKLINRHTNSQSQSDNVCMHAYAH